MKDYKKILERIVNIINTTENSDIGFTNICTYIGENCPEVQKSENERIRKELIDYINRLTVTPNNIDRYNSWIAWLEKQGDTNETIDRDEFAQGVLRGAAINLITWIDYNAAEGNTCLSNVQCKEIENALVRGDWNKIYAYMKKKLEKQSVKTSSFDFNPVDWQPSKVDSKIHNIYNVGVEPKFQNGQWVVWQDKCYKINYNGCRYELIDQNGLSTSLEHRTIDESAHLWTIQDAKDGDVLDANGAPFIYKKHDKDYVYFYCGVNLAGEFVEANEFDTWNNNNKVYPAIKEQRDLLFAKMKEAGYTFDSEKKELKKISQRMISAEAKETLYDKPAWSEEDEMNLKRLILYLSCREKIISEVKSRYINWLKSLKGRVQPQPKKEWSEEDEHRAKDTIYFLDTAKKHYASIVELDACINWLKTIKKRMEE